MRSKGLAAGDGARLTVYTSAETHTWVHKAAELCGLGTDAIRWIPTDAEQRLRTDQEHPARALTRATARSDKRTVASRAISGKIWPGRARSVGFDLGSIAT